MLGYAWQNCDPTIPTNIPGGKRLTLWQVQPQIQSQTHRQLLRSKDQARGATTATLYRGVEI